VAPQIAARLLAFDGGERPGSVFEWFRRVTGSCQIELKAAVAPAPARQPHRRPLTMRAPANRRPAPACLCVYAATRHLYT
jgi:hypothetical protein